MPEEKSENKKENNEKKDERKDEKFDITFGKITEDWALNSKFHSLSNIARSPSKVLKAFWLFFLLVSLGYCAYQIIITFIAYFQFNVITSLSQINEVTLQFPSVVVCNINPYNAEVAGPMINSILASKNLNQSSSYPNYLAYLDDVNFQIKSTLQYDAATNKSFDLKRNGFQLEQMLISCRFDLKPCSVADFEWFYSFDYGNCYRFGSADSPPRFVRLPGQQNGLRLEMYTGNRTTQEIYTYKSGLRVIIFNAWETVFTDLDGFDVAPSLLTNIEIYKTVQTHLPSPYSDCLSDLGPQAPRGKEPILSQLYQDFGLKRYEQKYCMKVCFQNYVIESCGCYSYNEPVSNRTLATNPNMTGCYESQQVACVENSTSKFYNSDAATKCSRQCPIECKIVRYSHGMSLAKYPSEWLSNQTDLNLKQTTERLLVNIYFSEMFYSLVEETPAMTVDQLLALVGGSLGLFLGASLLTLLEAVEFAYYVCLYFSIRNRERAAERHRHKFPIKPEIDENNANLMIFV